MIKAEWLKVLKTKKILIPLIGVLFIPVLYSAMFLWAFWDPYKNLEAMPVALVNEDKGAELDGVELEIGDALIEKLMDSKQFKFEEIQADDLEEKLQNREYYIAIKIPENFSEHATTLLEESPEKLKLEYVANEGFNFLGSQIGDTAMERVKSEVNTQVSATYAEKLFDSITKLGDGFTEAADGALKLDDGAKSVVDGANDIKGYLEQLASSTIELSDGTDQLYDGVKKAQTGANELATGVAKLADGSAQLATGAETAANGATQLEQGIEKYIAGVSQVVAGQEKLTTSQESLASNLNALANGTAGLDDKIKALADGSQNVSNGMSQLASQLEAILPSLPEEKQAALKATIAQLQSGSQQVSGGLSQLYSGTNGLDDKIAALSNGADQINAGQQQVQAGVNSLSSNSSQLVEGVNSLAAGNATLAAKLNELAAGANTASTGASTLASGLSELVNGTSTLNDGTTLLADKSSQLADGSSALADGTKQLANGTQTLSEKLAEAAGEVDVNPTEETFDMVGAPVDVEKTSMNPVANYGTGFTPYFMSLGLFVGALLMSIVFPLFEPAIRPKNGFSWFMSKFAVLGVAGIIQSLISVAIVILALGLEVESLPNFIVTTILTSFVFLAMVQLLVTVLGDPGRFVAILILILQLTTSAGTFPLELIPEPLHVFNSLLPMTYSVQAYKAAISMTDNSFLWTNWSILFSYFAVCIILTIGYFSLVCKKRYSKELAAE